MVDIDFSTHIGGMYQDVRSGKWSIIGASKEKSEAFNEKMHSNVFVLSEDDMSKMTRLKLEARCPAYSDMRNIPSNMPPHCFGTSYGNQYLKGIEQKMKSFYGSNENSYQEIKDYFKDCCRDMRVDLVQDRKTSGTVEADNRQIILDTYEQFRMENSVMAKWGNDEEGKGIAQENGWDDGDKDWVYYNSDYFYKSEKVMEAIKEAVSELADEWHIGEIDSSERDEDKYLSYSSSFHQVWKNGSENGDRLCSISDIEEMPPRDFSFFFREISTDKDHTGIVLVNSNGVSEKKSIVFNIFSDGKQHHFPQTHNLLDVFDKKYDSETSSFMKNFNIFTRYYGTVRLRER